MEHTAPREGDIHEIVNVGGHSFTIRYGYYTDAERLHADLLPIYPCFLTDPHYTSQGHPLVTRIQDACQFYQTADGIAGDGWCADCIYCTGAHSAIGICTCPDRSSRT